MYICAAGDIHGAMNKLYDEVERLARQAQLGSIDIVLMHDAPAGVRCIGLNKIPHPGNLYAIEMMQRERRWTALGEWPARQVA
jgi:hypothetical protein